VQKLRTILSRREIKLHAGPELMIEKEDRDRNGTVQHCKVIGSIPRL
jgi:hypothetical protein